MKTNTTTWSEELYAFQAGILRSRLRIFQNFHGLYPASWERLSAAVQRAITTESRTTWNLKSSVPLTELNDGLTLFGGVETDLEGLVTGLHGSVQDINARKMAEEALRESEIRFRDLFNNL